MADAPSDHPTALYHSFYVARFPTIGAKSVTFDLHTLPSLAAHIASTYASEKQWLPWHKLAGFGPLRSDKGSIRTNANVVTLFGVEGDHDAGFMTFEQACLRANRARLACLIYTSASHSARAHRWHILAPFRHPRPPIERDHMIARVNGVLMGSLTGESQTLSQAYRYGRVAGGMFAVEMVDGQFVDERPDLEEGAILPRPKRAPRPGFNPDAPPAPAASYSPGKRDILIDRILGVVRRAPAGKRHQARYDAARLLGGLSADLGLSGAEIADLILDARPPEADREREERAIYDGIATGRAAPLILGRSMQRFGLQPDMDFGHVVLPAGASSNGG